MRNAGPVRVARRGRDGFAGRALLIGIALVSMAGFLPIVVLSQPASASVVPSSTPVTSVNLADYGLVARYPLPSKANPLGGDTTCTGGSGDVLADEASAVTYDPNGAGGAGSLFILGDGGACVVQTTVTGTHIDSMTLGTGNSAQGTAFYDTEGLTYVGQDGGKPQLVMTEERYRQLDEFDYTANTTLTLADARAVKLGTTIGNIGLEGVAYDPATSNATGCSGQTVGSVTGNFCQGFVAVKEKQPEDIFQTNVDWGSRGAQSTDPATGTATNGGPESNEGSSNAPTPLFPPANANLNDFSDVFAMSNIASLDGTDTVAGADGTSYDGDLLMDSQESGSIELLNRSGTIKSRLDLLPNPSSGLDVVDETHEGVAMDQFGNLYVDSEDGAGPNAPELEVYAPTSDLDKSPTAISLATTKGTLPSTTTTANGPVKLSGLSVTDGDSDGIGTDVYTVTATDGGLHDVSSLFEADHTGLYLATGASLAGVPSPVTITVTVKDPNAVDASSFPNGITSSPFTLTINSVTAVTGSESKIIISEVDPSGSGSGNNSYGEDWFELTDTGTQPVSLTGWSADDSHEVAGKNPLFGVSTIDPGESVVFVQADTAVGATTTPADTVAAFRSDWGLSSKVQVGWYSDADGLSQSGDEVNVYDAGENFVTGVSFGAVENKVSFDNSAGITGAIDTFSDSGGDDGSFTDAEGETGSPGFAHIAPTVAITEVDPAGSSATYHADWFELTNYGTQAANLTGWTMDDNSAALDTSVSMTVGAASPVLAPGHSIVLAEDPADSSVSSSSESVATLNTDLPGLESAFETAWFAGGTAPSSFAFGVYGGKGVGLSTSGDAVNLFDASGNPVTGVTFGAASSSSPIATFDNAAGGSSVSTLSQVGVHGGFLSANGAEIGSPGTIVTTTPPPPPPSVAITEVDPSGSSMSYAADWFELTNTGTTSVDLTGWKMDDSSDALATAVSTTTGSGSPVLAPGHSIVLAEDPADSSVSSGSESVATLNTDLPSLESAFETAWFAGGTAPSSFAFGVYGGKGVGLSTSGDAVNLFDASGNPVTGVTFGAASSSSPIATFDNAAGGSSVSTLSQVGVHGGFLSANGVEIGSPGTITGVAPGAPTAVMATPGTNKATVSWTAPVQNGGSGIIGYTVTASPGGQTCQTTGAVTCVVNNLTDGTPTTFTVTATNGVGTGDPSVPSAAVTPSAVPDAPTAVAAVPGNALATVSFDPPFNEGSAITGYQVTATDSIHPAHGGQTASGTASPITVTGLTNGDNYTFAVVATNGDGDGPASAPSASVTPSNLVPLTLSAPPSIAVGSGKTLRWVITATGNPAPTITASNLPSWLTLKNGKPGKNATLTGKAPTTGGGGSFTVTVVAANGIEAQAEQSITINVLAFTSADHGAFTIGQSGSLSVSTSDSPANPTLSAKGLPAGLTFTDNGNGTATISGTPTTKVVKTVKVKLTASSNGATAKQVLAVSIAR